MNRRVCRSDRVNDARPAPRGTRYPMRGSGIGIASTPLSILSSLVRSISGKLARRRERSAAEIRDLMAKGQLEEARAALSDLAETTLQRDVMLHCLRGELAYREHDDAEAEHEFRAALAEAAGFGDAHYGLSLVLLARGEREDALRHAQFAQNCGGVEARYSAQLGLCHLELGNITKAAAPLSQATRLAPDDKSSWNNLGIVLRANGDVAGALQCFSRATEIDAGFAQAQANLAKLWSEGLIVRGASQEAPAPDGPIPATASSLDRIRELVAKGNTSLAVESCETYCLDNPDDPAGVIALYEAYRAHGDPQNGIDAYNAFLIRHPDSVDVKAELGKALVRAGEFKLAKPIISEIIDQRPEDADLLVAMAEVRTEQLRLADAGELYERAFALRQDLTMKGRLAASLVARCRYEEALVLLDEVIAEQPSAEDDVAGVRVYALTHLGRHDEALPVLDRVIARTPHDSGKRFPRATVHLLNQRFREGWADYAFRNLASARHLRMLPFPQWRGEPLEGKSIVVLAEQGLGDQVMFASCLPDLLACGPSRMVVEVVNRVAPTIARSFPQCEVVSTKQDNALEWVRDLGPIDCFIPMGDLPARFRRELNEFPAHRGYLKPDPVRVEHWRQQLAQGGSRPKIGVSWRGGTELTRTGLRSIDVLEIEPLQRAAGADWVCLQYGDVADDLARAKAAGIEMGYWRESIKDLDEFAALVSALDLVVTVCNTTVHYAGALNVPVWIMAPRVPEWRYGLNGPSMPWYPSAAIYRQASAGDWTDVFGRVANDLTARFPHM